MKKPAGLLLIVILAAMVASPVFAASNRTRFSQWIAPLECTRDEVLNGVTQTIILTPEECDDLLHPKPPDDDGSDNSHKPPHTTPKGPDTGVYRDPITDVALWLLFVGLSAIVIMAARRRMNPR